MKDLMSDLMDAAAAHGAYADARFVHSRSEGIATRNGEVDGLHNDESEGIGVRVRVGGAWGFAATRPTDRAAAEAALRRAASIARPPPRAPRPPPGRHPPRPRRP